MFEYPVKPSVLRQLMRFDEHTGEYFWKPRTVEMCSSESYCGRWNKRLAGKKVAMRLDPNGYRRVRIFGRNYSAHRLIWAFHYGEWPASFLDHINRDRSDNTLSNLRQVSAFENSRNCSMGSHNTSGVTGVSWNKKAGKWRAFIKHERKHIHLGTFDDKASAVAARIACASRLGNKNGLPA